MTSPDRTTLAIEFGARVLLAIATFAYFLSLAEPGWRFDLSLAVAALVAFLIGQTAILGRALFGAPAAWTAALAALLDALAIGAAVASDPVDVPPTLLLVLPAALNLGSRGGWLLFSGALGGAAIAVFLALAVRDGRTGVPTSGAVEFLILFMTVALAYFALANFRRTAVAAHAARHADQDAETQLLNRRGFDNAARYLAPLAQRTQLPLVIMLASVDARGGQPLDPRRLAAAVRQIAHGVRQRARRSDVVARLAPDEFVFMLFDTPLAGSETLARALLERFDAWARTQAPEARLTFGMILTPEDPVAIDQLIARARSSVQRAQKHPSSPPVVTAPAL